MKHNAKANGWRWLEQAQADRHGAQLLFDGGSYHLACFIAQQVAEKSVKAFLYTQGEEIVIGHSIAALCRWAAEFDHDFESLRQKVASLDAYYIPTRYPNGVPDNIPARIYTRSMAQTTLRMADAVLLLVQQKLSVNK